MNKANNSSFFSRSIRHLLYIFGAVILTLLVAIVWLHFTPRVQSADVVDAKPMEAFQKLMQGNVRFAGGNSKHPDESVKHRHEVAQSQHPFAVVVTCSDSRLSPELIFDQGLGDIFVIRTAGNIVSEMEMASIEYAVEHLHAKLIMIMGHENCGAIEALMNGETTHGHIKSIIDSLKQEMEIQPALAHHDLHAAVVANVQHQMRAVANDSLILQLNQKVPIAIRGSVYSLETGKVHLLDNKPLY